MGVKMKDIEQMIELETIVMEHQESLNRLIAYSVRGLLTPVQFIIELRKMQNQTLTRCLKKLSEDDKRQFLIEFEKI